MREILFKGKRIDNGKWVEGYYYKISETTYCFKEDYERKPVPEHHYILQERMTDWGLPNQMVQIEIDPKTLCQFTGMTDKNGKRIWENDIVEAWSQGSRAIGTVKQRVDGLWIMSPAWQNHEFWELKPNSNGETTVEVLVNAFDNPELLQEEHK
nr:MAG TPA: YopX protein [Caudoviricetes sp.]